MQGPIGRVVKGHILHRQIPDVFQKAHPRPEAPYIQRAFMESVIRIVIVKAKAPLSVDHAGSGDGNILLMPCQEKTAPLPAGILVIILEAIGEIRHILRLHAGNQPCALLQVQVHVGTQDQRSGQELPGRDHNSAAGFGAVIDCRLNCFRTLGCSI